MSLVKLKNAERLGTVELPPSKSAAHRALICQFLSGGGNVTGIINSNDMLATRNAIRAIQDDEDTIDCIESGSTLRFMLPVAAALGKVITFTGSGKLPQRPIGEYLELLPAHGVKCESAGGLPLKISGQLEAGRYEIRGDISSQYITGLLLALPLLDGDSEIVLTTPLQSAPYVEMTVRILGDYGVEIKKTENGYFVKGNQSFKVRDYDVEADWSQAAFFIVGAAISGEVTLTGLDLKSTQGDRMVLDVLKSLGAEIEAKENYIYVTKSKLRAATIDVSDIPDMVPAIAVAAAYAEGKTVIKGGERLRLKESDRIESVVSNLNKMGVKATETPDGMVIEGSKVKGADLDGYNDHRIVMAFSVAALNAKGETTITDALSVNKSYPDFFDDYNSLGGKADVISDR